MAPGVFFSGATKMKAEQALIALRKLHKAYVKSCGKRFADLPFTAKAVPGWVYLPMSNAVARADL
ncbi:hypothetical protein [Mesorhizobium sp. M8A.F.Ca.ET.021.01.1.1]|uniref:hypothetical protein n=1 Tax=Mesorhizobium sp. M8A.F.Ca.ET.021.01.1.1 TaxID=2496757 RepID=UPI000FD527DF|nr:hypothetical protein [Mesorhizobium sp. M8A.F.Ca.ET.021.01.1.1]RUW50977.1 hypothetical protein EOA36_15450 [Mesorhizobium sp. M8A.F.Ca.ET.021.01.1.1]